MARRLNYVEADIRSEYIAPKPGTPEYEAALDGREPTVLLIGDASEQKLAANYSDWLEANYKEKR